MYCKAAFVQCGILVEFGDVAARKIMFYDRTMFGISVPVGLLHMCRFTWAGCWSVRNECLATAGSGMALKRRGPARRLTNRRVAPSSCFTPRVHPKAARIVTARTYIDASIDPDREMHGCRRKMNDARHATCGLLFCEFSRVYMR